MVPWVLFCCAEALNWSERRRVRWTAGGQLCVMLRQKPLAPLGQCVMCRMSSVRLTKIFRQPQQSGVVTSTHRINQGLPPLTDGLPDFFLFVEDDADNAAGLDVDVVARRIPRKFGLDPRRDVQ